MLTIHDHDLSHLEKGIYYIFATLFLHEIVSVTIGSTKWENDNQMSHFWFNWKD